VIGLDAAVGFAGGIGLFLLGMTLMTEGLRLAAGPALERILAQSAGTRLRALASGTLVTAVVQSSTAVTVATIGFVNAGLLRLSQALWVIFGANVGTTMTGWLVALVGLQFAIEPYALVLVGLGMLLRFTGEGTRRGALGTALAGFGVLFLGIDLLKETFSGAAHRFTLPEIDGLLGTIAHVLAGTMLTVVMQSSSAALAVALTAAQGGMASTQVAAAVVIGANIGTTVTALIAAIGATPNAKRAAVAHVAFNLLTGAVALVLLPWLVAAIALGRRTLGLEAAAAAELALFHTVFNVLGILLMWPLAARLAAALRRRFRTREEDESKPRHLDATVLAVPSVALEALASEVRRTGGMATRMLRAALGEGGADPQAARRARHVVAALDHAIAEFVAKLSSEAMSDQSAARLAQVLLAARYHDSVADLAMEVCAAAAESAEPAEVRALADAFRASALQLIETVDPERVDRLREEPDPALAAAESDYGALKAALLAAGAAGRLPVAQMDAWLRAWSAARRALEQAVKAARALDPAVDAAAL